MVAAVKTRKLGVPVQRSLKGFVMRPAAAENGAAKPSKEQGNAEVADPDLARALAASLAQPSQPGSLDSQGEAQARDAGNEDCRQAAELSQGKLNDLFGVRSSDRTAKFGPMRDGSTSEKQELVRQRSKCIKRQLMREKKRLQILSHCLCQSRA